MTASRSSSRARSSGSTRSAPTRPTTCIPEWGSGSSISTTRCATDCSSSCDASPTSPDMPILVGSDLSAASLEALDLAIAFAKKRDDTELVVLHVVDPTVENVDDAVATAQAALDAI